MDIIVTGAGGFIGTDVIRELKESHSVFAITRSNPKIIQDGVNYLKADLLTVDIEDFLNISKQRKFDVLVHAAGQAHIPQTEESQVLFFKNNVAATVQTLKLAQRLGIRKFILLSTVAVLNNDETDFYAATKKKAEQIVAEFCLNNKMDYCIIRPVVVYGENDVKGNVYKLVKQLSLGFFPLFNGGKIIKSMIYVRNLSYLIRYMLESEDHYHCNEPLIACDKERYNIKEICGIIRSELGRKIILFNFPNFILNLAIFGLETLQRIGMLQGTNIASIKKLRINVCFELSKANKGLIERIPYSADDGLANTIRWLRENKHL